MNKEEVEYLQKIFEEKEKHDSVLIFFTKK